MGCNYYLRKKSICTPRKDRDEGWYENYDFDFYENEYNEVLELTNGYVFKNTYYKTVEELNKVYYLIYHIGKSSAGWRFLLQIYPEQGINNLEDWKELFKDGVIVDEYGEEVSQEDMLKKITKKEPSPGLKDKLFTIMHNETYEVRDGLIVHPLKWNIVDNSAKETYDVCEGDFS